jgi:nicotinamide-nucleotide adenylyltransferase
LRRALYIGRFQLFHLGHIEVLEYIAAAPDVDEIILAVGSSQYDDQERSPVATWCANPFRYDERCEMITRSLAAVRLSKPWSVHRLPDYHDCNLWWAHIETKLPAFAVLYSASPREWRLFRQHGKEARDFPRRRSFHAGIIRQAMIDSNADYRTFLPPGTLEVLDEIGAVARLRELAARDERDGPPAVTME